MKLNNILGFENIEPETINYEIKPGIYELNEIVNAFALKIAEHKCKNCKDENISLIIKADKIIYENDFRNKS